MTRLIGIDPRTGLPVSDGVPETTPAELAKVTAVASAALLSITDGYAPPPVRATLLRALADALDAEVDDLVALATAETGLPVTRLTGEIARTSFQLRLFATVIEDGAYLEAVIDTADPAAVPIPRPDLRRLLVPVGVVAVFAASNFPFAFSVLGGDTASALAVGSPVVVKAHPAHPATSARTGALASTVIEKLGLPAGVFGLVHGSEAGRLLVLDPTVKAVGFTGSTAGGRALFDLASARPEPIPFYGELGSVNPSVVTPAAVAARGPEIAAGFVASFTLGQGQFCTKPGLLFLPAGHGLGDTLAAAIETTAAGPMLDARIKRGFTDGTDRLAAHPGVSEIAFGEALLEPVEGSWATPRLYTTDAETFSADADAAVLGSECFGPSSLIVEYTDAADLARALQTVEGSLTGTIHAEGEQDPFPVADLITTLATRVGRVVYNAWPTGVAVTSAMQHGGPWPASTNSLHTSVGTTAVRRWLRPVSYQGIPDHLLPPALQDRNPLSLPRRYDGTAATR